MAAAGLCWGGGDTAGLRCLAAAAAAVQRSKVQHLLSVLSCLLCCLVCPPAGVLLGVGAVHQVVWTACGAALGRCDRHTTQEQ